MMNITRPFTVFTPTRNPFHPRPPRSLRHLRESTGILPYQQERIKIDGMYKLPENKKVVDEYKDILISVSEKGGSEPL